MRHHPGKFLKLHLHTALITLMTLRPVVYISFPHQTVSYLRAEFLSYFHKEHLVMNDESPRSAADTLKKALRIFSHLVQEFAQTKVSIPLSTCFRSDDV